MCGEKFEHLGKGQEAQGSPPHVRGKVRSTSVSLPMYRITPACAGKSNRNSGDCNSGEDHPRMCGEKSRFPSPPLSRRGSPPHVRGKDEPSRTFVCALRITPACAGKSVYYVYKTVFFGDHPRMCGEKTMGWRRPKNTCGSPPHVRGKDTQNAQKYTLGGITPACAGKSRR